MVARLGELPLWAVMVAALLGAVVGDQVGFAVGRRLGPRLLGRFGRGKGAAEQTVSFVRRRGGWAVALGRWTALFRAFVPSVAGASGLRRRTFTLANLLGGTSWAVAVSLLGYFAGAAYQQVLDTMGRFGDMALVVVAAAGVVSLVVHRRRLRSSTGRPA